MLAFPGCKGKQPATDVPSQIAPTPESEPDLEVQEALDSSPEPVEPNPVARIVAQAGDRFWPSGDFRGNFAVVDDHFLAGGEDDGSLRLYWAGLHHPETAQAPAETAELSGGAATILGFEEHALIFEWLLSDQADDRTLQVSRWQPESGLSAPQAVVLPNDLTPTAATLHFQRASENQFAVIVQTSEDSALIQFFGDDQLPTSLAGARQLPAEGWVRGLLPVDDGVFVVQRSAGVWFITKVTAETTHTPAEYSSGDSNPVFFVRDYEVMVWETDAAPTTLVGVPADGLEGLAAYHRNRESLSEIPDGLLFMDQTVILTQTVELVTQHSSRTLFVPEIRRIGTACDQEDAGRAYYPSLHSQAVFIRSGSCIGAIDLSALLRNQETEER